MNTRPEITISSLDADRLYKLLASMPANSFAGKNELETELGRANIV
ncbi:MAG: nucleoside diphosphate kinase regulator, partial [Gammaproteobacteria bacterium]